MGEVLGTDKRVAEKPYLNRGVRKVWDGTRTRLGKAAPSRMYASLDEEGPQPPIYI
jgi:hypothetical protein